jgi:hypothetical protein
VFKEINIGNNVIIGWKTVIMSGVTIADNTVIGSHSTVTKSLLDAKAIYAGSPAKLIKHITEPSQQEKHDMIRGLIDDFKDLMSYYDIPDFSINSDYPYLYINQLCINMTDFSYEGEHDSISDAFRDFARRYGIRIYVPHGFKFNLTRK